MTKRIMVDIESLGPQPGGVILSIGWVRFGMDGVRLETAEERRISVSSCLECGLVVDGPTAEFWLDQTGKPWRDETCEGDLETALCDIAEAWKGADEIWAKPPSYDIAAIYGAFKAFNSRYSDGCSDLISPTWSFRAESCFRTLKRLTPDGVVLPEMDGTKHGALDDAIQQAREAVVILKSLKGLT